MIDNETALRWIELDCTRNGECIVYRPIVVVLTSVAAVSLGMDCGTLLAGPPAISERRRDVVVLRHCDLDYEQATACERT